MAVFRVPLPRGMGLHPARSLIERYVRAPPPWIHVSVYCAIYRGVAYLRGSITGNFGRPLPGVTRYFAHDGEVMGSFTSNLSGRFNVPLPLSGQLGPMWPDVAWMPVQCVNPKVNVGYTSSLH